MNDMPVELADLSLFPGIEPPVEDGACYRDNAIIKADYYRRITGLPTLADDSGLEISAFGGEPGIYSARYIRPDISFEKRNRIVLQRLQDIPADERCARFVCCCVMALNGGEIIHETGILEGAIGTEIRGKFGFGYDPIFLLPDRGIHLAELSADEKNRISHRARAFEKMKKNISALLKGNNKTR